MEKENTFGPLFYSVQPPGAHSRVDVTFIYHTVRYIRFERYCVQPVKLTAETRLFTSLTLLYI